jgi:hypothetical protein
MGALLVCRLPRIWVSQRILPCPPRPQRTQLCARLHSGFMQVPALNFLHTST